MSIRPWRDIQRKKTRKIKVGNVEIGGDAPISVQSMTNTLTTDVKATIEGMFKASLAPSFTTNEATLKSVSIFERYSPTSMWHISHRTDVNVVQSYCSSETAA